MAISQRSLYGVVGGLSNTPPMYPPGSPPSAAGFLGGLFSGLSGTLGGFARYTDRTHEEERQRMMDMIAERRVRLEEARLEEERAYHKALLTRPARGSSSSASSAPVIYGATDPEGDVQPVDVGQHFGVSNNALRKALDRQAVASLFPKTGAPDETFERFKAEAAYKAAHPELFPNEGFGETNTEVLKYDAFGRPIQTRSLRTTGKRPGLPRNEKLAQETAALNNSIDPAELLKVSLDPSAEPETRRAAAAKRIRLMSAGTPSQVR